MSNPKSAIYFKALKNLVSSLEDNKSLRDVRQNGKDLYSLFDRKLKTQSKLSEISYQEKLVFLESFYMWKYFYDTVGGNHKTIANVELKTYPYFFVHKPEKKAHEVQTEALVKKLRINSEDFSRIVDKGKEVELKLRQRKKINNLFKDQIISDKQINLKKAFEVFKLLFPYAPLLEEEIKVIVTDISLFFVIPQLVDLKKKSSFNKRSVAQKKKTIDFYKNINNFRFKYFENFPTFSIFNANEISKDQLEKWSEKVNIPIHLFKMLLNSQTMLHFENRIEEYMIHDTWGHIWQSELAQGKLHYDQMANRDITFYPEQKLQIGEDIVSFSDLFYINFDGKLVYDEEFALQFIEQYFADSIKLHFYAIMSEMCAEITEYLFVFDYGTNIPLNSSSKFNHNPAKFDFAWSDVNYFSQKLNSPHKKLINNKSEFNKFIKKLQDILKQKNPTQYKNAKSSKNLAKEIELSTQCFFDKFNELYELYFTDPLVKIDSKNKVLEIFLQVLKTQSRVNDVYRDFFAEEGEDLSEFRIIALLYIYKIFEDDPEQNFWKLDDIINDNLITLLKTIK